jgi:O-antigen/teichoic acid export membrane protein
MLRVLARNTISNGAATLAKLAINFLLTPFLILHLGKELYGIWSLLISFSLSGTLSLLSLGVQAALVKHVAEYHALHKWKELNQVISCTLFVYTLMGALGAAFLVVFSHLWLARCFTIPTAHLYTVTLMMDFIAVQVLFELPGLCFNGVLEGVQRYDLLAAMEAGKAALLAGLFATALLRGHTIIVLSAITLGVTFAYSLGLLLLANRELPEWRLVWRFDREQMLSVVDMTKDLFILRLNGIIYNNMDKMIIAAVLTTTAVTDYDIGNRIHTMALMVLGLAGTVVIPAASAAHARSESDRIRTLFLMGTKYTLAMTLPVVCTLFVLASSMIRYWISPQYVGAALYARLFLAYLLFWVMTGVGWNMLIGIRLTKPIVKIQIVSVAINLALSILLVHLIGIKGVIIATIIGNLVAFIPYMRLIMSSFQVTLGELFSEVVFTTYPQALASTGFLVLMTNIWRPGSIIAVIMQAIIAVAVYEILFFFTGMRRGERERMLSLVSPRLGKLARSEV